MNESQMPSSDEIMNNIDEIETVRFQLNQTRIEDFVESLVSEDLSATHHNLVTTISQSLTELLKVQRQFVLDAVEGENDTICPGCVMANTRDLVRTESVIENFNHFIIASNQEASCD